jgi:hypothetical protein
MERVGFGKRPGLLAVVQVTDVVDADVTEQDLLSIRIV